MLIAVEQNPYASPGPVVEKVLIVCPVSLVNVKQSIMCCAACRSVDIWFQNWKAEFHKWLGRDRIGVAACDKDKKVARSFMNAFVRLLESSVDNSFISFF